MLCAVCCVLCDDRDMLHTAHAGLTGMWVVHGFVLDTLVIGVLPFLSKDASDAQRADKVCVRVPTRTPRRTVPMIVVGQAPAPFFPPPPPPPPPPHTRTGADLLSTGRRAIGLLRSLAPGAGFAPPVLPPAKRRRSPCAANPEHCARHLPALAPRINICHARALRC